MRSQFDDYFTPDGEKPLTAEQIKEIKKSKAMTVRECWSGMLSGKTGRRALWEHLQAMKPGGAFFTGNSQTYFNCGLKHCYDQFDAMLKSIDIENYCKMLQENLHDKTRD